MRKTLGNRIKTLWLAVAALLLTACFCIPTFAAGGPQIQILGISPQGKTSGPVTITFSAADESGITSLTIAGQEMYPDGGTYVDGDWVVHFNTDVIITARNSHGMSSTRIVSVNNIVDVNGNMAPRTNSVEGIHDGQELIDGGYDYQFEYNPNEAVTPGPGTQGPAQPAVQPTQPQTQAPIPVLPTEPVTQAPTTEAQTEPSTVETTTATEAETETETTVEETTEEETTTVYVLPERIKRPDTPTTVTILREVKKIGNRFHIEPPEKFDFTEVYEKAYAKSKTLRLIIPKSPDVTTALQYAENVGRKLKLTIPKTPDVSLILGSAKQYGNEYTAAKEAAEQPVTMAWVEFEQSPEEESSAEPASDTETTEVPETEEEDIDWFDYEDNRMRPLPNALVDTLTPKEAAGVSTPVLILLAILTALLVYNIGMLIIRNKKTRIYKDYLRTIALRDPSKDAKAKPLVIKKSVPQAKASTGRSRKKRK